MPRKIRDLLKDYRKMGATISKSGGKGDHSKIKHPEFRGCVILDGRPGDDAKRYQESDLIQFKRGIKK